MSHEVCGLEYFAKCFLIAYSGSEFFDAAQVPGKSIMQYGSGFWEKNLLSMEARPSAIDYLKPFCAHEAVPAIALCLTAKKPFD